MKPAPTLTPAQLTAHAEASLLDWQDFAESEGWDPTPVATRWDESRWKPGIPCFVVVDPQGNEWAYLADPEGPATWAAALDRLVEAQQGRHPQPISAAGEVPAAA